MRIFCLIPAYNEKGNLLPLTKALIKIFNKEKIQHDIFYVIQGSDGSKQEIEKIKKKYKNVFYVYFPQPLGIGKAYQEGFKRISQKATHVFTLDADLNHNPNYLPQFISCMDKNNSDVVIGSRYMNGGKFHDRRMWKRILSLMMNTWITLLLSIPVHDISSGFRLVKKEVIQKILNKLTERNYPSYMEFIIQSHKHGFKLSETSIIYTPRSWGKSKMNWIKTMHDYVLFLPRIFSFIF